MSTDTLGDRMKELEQVEASRQCRSERKKKESNVDQSLKRAIEEGEAIVAEEQRRTAEAKQRVAAAEQQAAESLKAILREEWITNGRLYDEVRKAVAAGKDHFDVQRDPLLAVVLREVSGINAVSRVERIRMADDTPLYDTNFVRVTWSKPT